MFEAIFRITAQVKSDEQGQRVFRVTEREAPANDAEFLSRLATLYQQEVYTTLQPGDDLTVAVRLDLTLTRFCGVSECGNSLHLLLIGDRTADPRTRFSGYQRNSP